MKIQITNKRIPNGKYICSVSEAVSRFVNSGCRDGQLERLQDQINKQNQLLAEIISSYSKVPKAITDLLAHWGEKVEAIKD